MVKKRGIGIVFVKVFLLPFIVYGSAGYLFIYIFQDSNISQDILNLSPDSSRRILDLLMMLSFMTLWRFLIYRYYTFMKKEVNKRHILYWWIVMAIFILGYLIQLILYLIIQFLK